MEGIHGAAQRGDEEEVTRLLDGDPTLLERRNDMGKTPLVLAAEHGQLGVVKLLVQRGANINAQLYGMTALLYAAVQGHEEVVAFLLEKGAQSTTRDDDNVTPLMLACGYGHLDVVRMLVQHTGGEGIDARDGIHDWTALHHAACGSHEQIVRFLLFAGADPTLTDNEGRTPQEVATPELDEDMDDEEWRARCARCVAVFEVSEHTYGRSHGDLSLVCTKQHDQPIAQLQRHLSYTLSLMHLPARSLITLVWQWWEGELERRYVLSRAMCLHKAYTTQRDLPTSQVPTYLEARVAAGHAVPVVEVVWAQSEGQQAEQAGASGEGRTAGEGGEAQGAEAGEEEEEQRHAVVEYVVTGLNEELIRELLEGFHV
jgi:hypothetical protein